MKKSTILKKLRRERGKLEQSRRNLLNPNLSTEYNRRAESDAQREIKYLQELLQQSQVLD